MSLRKLIMGLLLIACGLFSAAPAKADGLFFSEVKLFLLNATPAVGVDLFANQGFVITAPNNIASISILLTGTLPAGGDTLHISAVATNENGTYIPIDQSLVNVRIGTGFTFPTSFQGTTITFTVDLLNSSPDFIIPSGPNAGQAVNSFTYTFTVVEPVPEPTTLVLLITGIAGIGVKTFRSYRAHRT
jgi:hypothetical protein